MVERAVSARSEAVQEFAASLRDLRASAGTPSFREMSGRSQAISHTTLHEAAQGLRLPSWPTTVEYVKACGADPADYRERWERADSAVKAGSPTPAVAPAAAPVDVPAPPPVPELEVRAADPAAARPSRRRRTVALVAAGAVAVTAAVVAVVIVSTRGDDAGAPATSPSGMTAADCPVQQRNPAPVEPATAGDQAAFISDITLPDCSHVGRGETVVKTWRFKNVGTVPWVGYSLHRVDLPQERDQCQTIADIAIDDTVPGEVVDVSTTVTTPQQAGFCFVRFKVEDASGRLAFPGARPVNFQVVVD